MNVLGVTCARGGSKGVKNKNIRELCGKPLIAWTIEEAKKCTLLTNYVVTSDCKETRRLSETLGADTIEEPDELAMDNSPISDALCHALQVAEDRYGETYDAVADLRATNPFKTAYDIDRCIALLEEYNVDTDGVVGVTRLHDHHPSRIKHIVAGQLVDFWPEPAGGLRQDLKPEAYIRNGSIYVFWAELLRAGRYYIEADVIRPWVMPEERSVNIDTEIDFILAEAIHERIHSRD